MAGGGRAFRFICENRKRRFQTVGEIAGFGNRSLHGVLALIEQGVQIVDERLYFPRISADDAPVASGV